MRTLRRELVVTNPPKDGDWSKSCNGGNYAFGYEVSTMVAPLSEVYDGPRITHPFVLAHHLADKMETIGQKNGKVFFRLTSEWCSSDFQTCAICGRFDESCRDGICQWCHPEYHWRDKE